MRTEQTPIDLGRVADPQRETLRVLLVTPWNVACGVSEHSRMLKEAVEAADPTVEIVPYDNLDPGGLPTSGTVKRSYDLLHLNYQASLHSRWTPDAIRAWREIYTKPVVVTYHDTGVPNSDQCRSVIDAADAAVVHEPFDDLPVEKTFYWRMGVPEVETDPLGSLDLDDRPWLGTVGFPFPWKCYDELAKVTQANGWGLRLLAPNATADDVARWRALNPWITIERRFLPQDVVIATLRLCDATAFTYVCHNTGQSGAILQGIAAGKPVIALRTCRQMRALALDPLGAEKIYWAETFEDVGRILRGLPLGRLDGGTVALREQESWRYLGKKYAALYRRCLEG